ncbi:TRAF-type zinc finger, partial [Oesophagostomum dentatum]
MKSHSKKDYLTSVPAPSAISPTPCPVCQAEVTAESLKSDKKKHRQVQALVVKCPFHHDGCSWEGPLKEMQRHAERCEYHAIPCTNECGKMVPEREMAEHLATCQKKLGRCNYCNLQVKSAHLEKHLKICPRMIISCPFQCGLVDRPREEIEKHRSSCPNVDSACPFVEIGCSYVGDKGSVQKHLTDEPIRHLMYLCDEVTELKNFHIMIQSQNTAIEERYEELMKKTQTAAQMYGAQLVWRIEDVAQKMNDAK